MRNEKLEYLVNIQTAERIKAIVARLNVKLDKAGFDTVKVEVSIFNNEALKMEECWVTLDIPPFTANGWSVKALCKPAVDSQKYIYPSDRNFVIPADILKLPADYCSCCKKRRKRNFSTIIHHEDGITMQIGSSCLKEYFGETEKLINSAINALARIKKESEVHPYVPVLLPTPEEALQHIITVLKKSDYVPTTSGKYSTAKEALSNFRNGCDISEDSEYWADKLISWAEKRQSKNYAWDNACVALSQPCGSFEMVKWLAWLTQVYKKEKGQYKHSEIHYSRGDIVREKLNVRFTNIYSRRNVKGTYRFSVLVNGADQQFVLLSPTEREYLGESLKITGHSFYKGKLQFRCKFLEVSNV